MHENPIALETYNRLADAYAAHIDTKARNAYYDRPAVTSMLPPVAGKRVLDAGCGPGVYAEWLCERGAVVVAIDVCPRMVQLAKARLGDRATVLEANLGGPLDILPSASFDLVLAPLALDYVRDWDAVFREFYRLLHDGGHFVFSVEHPADAFYEHHAHTNYFETVRVEYEWRGFGVVVSMPSYRRPLQAMVTPLLEAGFVLERLLEPQPIPQFEQQNTKDYHKLMRQPGFICFRARKPA